MEAEQQPKGRGQNKQYWTPEEDKALIDALVELSTSSFWRAENGFRSGYLVQLERMIQEKIPQTQLKAVPNIESRVKLLRSKTNVISDILQLSGFDWNFQNSTIICDKSAYDEYVKTHKEAAGLYGKSFPFFDDLAPVFTKDRAFGNNRGDIGDDTTQYEQEDDILLEEGAGLSQMPSDDLPMPTQEPMQGPSPMPSDNSTSTTSRFRKRKSVAKDPTMDHISTSFDAFVKMVGPEFRALAEAAARNAKAAARTAESAARKAESAARNVEIAARNAEISACNIEITTRNETSRANIRAKKRTLSDVLFSIDGLSEDEAMFMLQVLAKDEDQLTVFWDLPAERKLRFCRVYLSRMSYCPPNA